MRKDITGVILAGGKSSRFGSNKALIMIEQVLAPFNNTFENTIVLVKDPSLFWFLESPRVHIAQDLEPTFHPLNGLISALTFSPTEKICLSACDMPFLSASLLDYLCLKSNAYDITAPIYHGRPQPLCAIYSKKCLAAIHQLDLLNKPEHGLSYLMTQVPTHFVLEHEWNENGISDDAFFDIDTPSDYHRMQRIMEGHHAG